MLKNFEFGDEAFTYIRSCLEQGHTLSSQLLGLALEQGKVISHLPETVLLEQSLNFKSGGIAKVNETEGYIITLIADFLSSTAHSYVIFEDSVACPEDQYLASDNYQFFIYNSHVYHFLTEQDVTKEIISRAIRAATSYSFTGVLVSLSDNLDVQKGKSMDSDSFNLISQNIKHILIGAYDGEGVLIWKTVDNK
jgi:hypothetical protein